MAMGDEVSVVQQRRLFEVVAPVSVVSLWARYRLRYSLVVGDAVSIAFGQLVGVWLVGWSGSLLTVLGVVGFGVVAGLLLVRSQGLFLARVSSIRVIEATRLARAMTMLGFVMFGADRVLRFGLTVGAVTAASVLSYVVLLISRSVYRAWVGAARQAGRFGRRVVIVGADDEAARLTKLFSVHREIGIEVVGVFGDRNQAVRRALGPLWRGPVSDTAVAAAALGASGVIVCPGVLGSGELNRLIRVLQGQNIHVHLGLGVSGIDTRRLQSLPVAYEPLLYCEPVSVSVWHVGVKRVFDVVGSLLAIVVASPVLAVIALAVKFGDGGPVLFRQKRVGRDGTEFLVIKFRTMAVDAEARLAGLVRDNERHGPLFKMERDPRITRVGHFLRSSSLDELPQLFNVVKGEMSLIGPRPALPSEVEQFSDEVRLRERVRPGITGLWQVEARDNPSFDAYQRLDAFYLDNWSILLDVAIIIGTVEQVCMRFIATVLRRVRSDELVLGASAVSAVDELAVDELAVPRAVGDGFDNYEPAARRSGRKSSHRSTSVHLTQVTDSSDR